MKSSQDKVISWYKGMLNNAQAAYDKAQREKASEDVLSRLELDLVSISTELDKLIAKQQLHEASANIRNISSAEHDTQPVSTLQNNEFTKHDSAINSKEYRDLQFEIERRKTILQNKQSEYKLAQQQGASTKYLSELKPYIDYHSRKLEELLTKQKSLQSPNYNHAHRANVQHTDKTATTVNLTSNKIVNDNSLQHKPQLDASHQEKAEIENTKKIIADKQALYSRALQQGQTKSDLLWLKKQIDTNVTKLEQLLAQQPLHEVSSNNNMASTQPKGASFATTVSHSNKIVNDNSLQHKPQLSTFDKEAYIHKGDRIDSSVEKNVANNERLYQKVLDLKPTTQDSKYSYGPINKNIYTKTFEAIFGLMLQDMENQGVSGYVPNITYTKQRVGIEEKVMMRINNHRYVSELDETISTQEFELKHFISNINFRQLEISAQDKEKYVGAIKHVLPNKAQSPRDISADIKTNDFHDNYGLNKLDDASKVALALYTNNSNNMNRVMYDLNNLGEQYLATYIPSALTTVAVGTGATQDSQLVSYEYVSRTESAGNVHNRKTVLNFARLNELIDNVEHGRVTSTSSLLSTTPINNGMYHTPNTNSGENTSWMIIIKGIKAPHIKPLSEYSYEEETLGGASQQLLWKSYAKTSDGKYIFIAEAIEVPTDFIPIADNLAANIGIHGKLMATKNTIGEIKKLVNVVEEYACVADIKSISKAISAANSINALAEKIILFTKEAKLEAKVVIEASNADRASLQDKAIVKEVESNLKSIEELQAISSEYADTTKYLANMALQHIITSGQAISEIINEAQLAVKNAQKLSDEANANAKYAFNENCAIDRVTLDHNNIHAVEAKNAADLYSAFAASEASKATQELNDANLLLQHLNATINNNHDFMLGSVIDEHNG